MPKENEPDSLSPVNLKQEHRLLRLIRFRFVLKKKEFGKASGTQRETE